ncbi:MAG TPA: Crp/Fnr family transcriptional regulator [Actinomycetota bacterium]|nr:Crp/Fnr family transcriptional regulator [Actinomycetota bacterium]
MTHVEHHAPVSCVPGLATPRRPTFNRLLAGLPPDDLGRLLPQLEPVRLEVRQALFEPNWPIGHVYFVESGLVSVVAGTNGHGLVEVAPIGCEGMVGLPVVLEAETSPHRAMVQVAGRALRMSADDLRQAIGEIGALRTLLLRYGQALMVQAAQGVACNGRHAINGRLARWLLQAHDREADDRIPLTHELISQMLGVRRAGVTTALGALEATGVIDASRGCITVLDRAGLERASCECYGIVRAEFDKLLG